MVMMGVVLLLLLGSDRSYKTSAPVTRRVVLMGEIDVLFAM